MRGVSIPWEFKYFRIPFYTLLIQSLRKCILKKTHPTLYHININSNRETKKTIQSV